MFFTEMTKDSQESSGSARRLTAAHLWGSPAAAAFASTMLWIVFNGLCVGSNDHNHIFTHFLKQAKPHLFANDLVFNSTELQYFAFAIISNALHSILSYSSLFLVYQALSIFFLFYVLTLLVRELSGERFPTILPAILLIVTGTELALDQHITHAYFYFQYPASAFQFLLTLFLIQNRLLAACICNLLAFLCHPQLAIYGLALLLLGMILVPSLRKQHLWPSLGVIGLTVAGLLGMTQHYGVASAGDIEQYKDILVHLRAPAHFLLSNATREQFLGLLAILLFSLLGSYRLAGGPARIILFLIVGGCALGVAAMAALPHVPGLFLLQMNPGKTLPLLHGVGLFLGAVWIMRRIRQGQWLVAALPLCSQSAYAVFMILFIDMLLDTLTIRFRRDVPKLVHSGAVIALSVLLIGLGTPTLLKTQLLFFGGTVVFITICRRATRINTRPLLVLSAIICTTLMITMNGGRLGNSILHVVRPDPDVVEVCKAAGNLSEDASLIIPPGMSAFQLLSERSAFASFKHMPRTPEAGLEWLRRMEALHAISPPGGDIRSGSRLQSQGYHSLTTQDIMNIHHRYPVQTHVIVSADRSLDLPLIFENASYRLYSLTQDQQSR